MARFAILQGSEEEDRPVQKWSNGVVPTVPDAITMGAPWSTILHRTRGYEYGTNNSDTATLVNESWASIDGLQTGSISFGLTNMSATTVNLGAGTRTVVVTAPDGSTTTTSYSYSRPTSMVRKNASGSSPQPPPGPGRTHEILGK